MLQHGVTPAAFGRKSTVISQKWQTFTSRYCQRPLPSDKYQPKTSTLEEDHVIRKTYCIALGSFQMNIWLSEGRRSFAMHAKKLCHGKKKYFKLPLCFKKHATGKEKLKKSKMIEQALTESGGNSPRQQTPISWTSLQTRSSGIIFESRNSSRQNWHRSEERRVGKECRSRWSPYH